MLKSKLPISFLVVVVLYLINFTSLLLLADSKPLYASFMALLEELNTAKPQLRLINHKPTTAKKLTMADLERKQKELFSAKPDSYLSADGSFEATGFSAEPECYFLPLTTGAVYKYQWVGNSSDENQPLQHYILVSDFVNENYSNLTKVGAIDLLEKAAIVFSDWLGDAITSKSNVKISLSNHSICIESQNESFNTQKIEYYFFHKNKLFIVGTLQRLYGELSGMEKLAVKIRFCSQIEKFVKRLKLK